MSRFDDDDECENAVSSCTDFASSRLLPDVVIKCTNLAGKTRNRQAQTGAKAHQALLRCT